MRLHHEKFKVGYCPEGWDTFTKAALMLDMLKRDWNGSWFVQA